MSARQTAFCLLWGLSLTLGLLVRGEAQEGFYTLGPGDVLELTIFAGGEVQQKVMGLSVSQEGTVNCPFLGEMKVAGRTVSQVAEEIRGVLARDYFVDPQVILSLKEYHSRKVYILGEVIRPGLYELSNHITLLQLISQAGGTKPERGKEALLLRAAAKDLPNSGNGEIEIEKVLREHDPVRVDLGELLGKGNLAADLPLETGDVVYIPPRDSPDAPEPDIYVMGEVEKPGAFKFQEGLTALRACILAGGFTPYAAPNRATITRKEGEKSVVTQIDLNAVRKGKVEDPSLRPGDRVDVPESRF